MKKITINTAQHPLYAQFAQLYASSFPLFEQRTDTQQIAAFGSSNYHLSAFTEGEAFVGFVSYWEFESYLYIEHFAINQMLRGGGYGSRILADFVAATPKTVLLEIDPVVDSVSRARLRFYLKCGFVENGYEHTHPPYREGRKGHSLVILSSAGPLSVSDYEEFNDDLINVVMSMS